MRQRDSFAAFFAPATDKPAPGLRFVRPSADYLSSDAGSIASALPPPHYEGARGLVVFDYVRIIPSSKWLVQRKSNASSYRVG